jgi:hypothetical protein
MVCKIRLYLDGLPPGRFILSFKQYLHMNDLLEAARSSEDEDEEDPSKNRFNSVKREKAGLDDRSPSEKRYDELKEDAKEELLEDAEEDEGGEEESSGFVTH